MKIKNNNSWWHDAYDKMMNEWENGKPKHRHKPSKKELKELEDYLKSKE